KNSDSFAAGIGIKVAVRVEGHGNGRGLGLAGDVERIETAIFSGAEATATHTSEGVRVAAAMDAVVVVAPVVVAVDEGSTRRRRKYSHNGCSNKGPDSHPEASFKFL